MNLHVPATMVDVQGGGSLLDSPLVQPLEAEHLPVRLTGLGRFELLDGHHRAARHACEGRAIPVRVVEVSPLWGRLVEDLRGMYPGRELLYQAIEHPFFEAWQTDRSSERIAMIFDALNDAAVPPSAGHFVDVGCCTGRIVREARRRGFRVFGVDRDPRAVRVAEHLDLVFGTGATYYCRPFTFEDMTHGFASAGVGVVVCLSVFHRALAEGRVDEVAALYREMAQRSRAFFVDAGSPEDTSLATSPVPWNREGYAAWLRSVVGPGREVHELGETEGRVLFSVLHSGHDAEA